MNTHAPIIQSTSEHKHIAAMLRLSRAELSPPRLASLLSAASNCPERIFDMDRDEWTQLGLTESQAQRLYRASLESIDSDLRKFEALGATVLGISDPDYPQALRQLPDAPPFLFVRGKLLSDDQFSIAIVGSRRATEYGLSIAERFARELVGHGLCVVSGGARGVDTKAHRGALDSGGRTIAVIGSGLDINYPSENRRLYDEIVQTGRGAIVTEYPLGATPEPWHFPARNRLISGIALGSLVLESPIDSGAMITARYAAEQGREVFAVPGPIELGRSSGCHKLIQEGAKLVQSVDDILEEIGVFRLRSDDKDASMSLMPEPVGAIDPDQRKVLDQLTLQARHVDQLASDCKMPAASVVGILTMLELRGLARRVPGNAFVRVL